MIGSDVTVAQAMGMRAQSVFNFCPLQIERPAGCIGSRS